MGGMSRSPPPPGLDAGNGPHRGDFAGHCPHVHPHPCDTWAHGETHDRCHWNVAASLPHRPACSPTLVGYGYVPARHPG